MLMSGSKKLSEKAKGKQKAKAAALPLGRALLSASLPLSSKKREHQLTVPELSTAAGPSGTGVSERQIRRDNVLNIRWLERVDEQNRSRVFDPHGAEQTVPLKTTLPRKVPEWERTSTSRRVLTANDEDEYIEMCRAILEEKPTYSLLRHLQQKRTQGGASKAPAAAATAGPAVAAGPGVAAVRAHRHFTAPLPSPPAQGVRRGPRRAARRAGPGNNRQ